MRPSPEPFLKKEASPAVLRGREFLKPEFFRNFFWKVPVVLQVRKNSLNTKFLGGIFLGHPGPRRRDIPDKNFMQVAFFCCFRQGVAGMSRDLGRDVPHLEKLYARKLWADFSYPSTGGMAHIGIHRTRKKLVLKRACPRQPLSRRDSSCDFRCIFLPIWRPMLGYSGQP